MCRQQVQATTCAFNNCEWKYTGRILEWKTPPRSVGAQDKWYFADNGYWVFDENIIANWLELIITTRKRDDVRSYSSDA